MKTKVLVKLIWILPSEGGKKSIPVSGVRYAPIIKILGDDDETEWSVVINITKTDGMCSCGELGYLVDWAPHQKLSAMKNFQLYEGDVLVAYGEMVESYKQHSC